MAAKEDKMREIEKDNIKAKSKMSKVRCPAVSTCMCRLWRLAGYGGYGGNAELSAVAAACLFRQYWPYPSAPDDVCMAPRRPRSCGSRSRRPRRSPTTRTLARCLCVLLYLMTSQQQDEAHSPPCPTVQSESTFAADGLQVAKNAKRWN